MINDKPILDRFNQFYLTAIKKKIGNLAIPSDTFLKAFDIETDANKFNNFYKLNKGTYLLFHLIDVKLVKGKFLIKFHYYAKYNSDLKYSRNFLLKKEKHRSKKIKLIERNKQNEIPLFVN
jgi:hypothetical protein